MTHVSMLSFFFFYSNWGSEFKKCLPAFLSARFYQKIQQTMKIQDILRKSMLLGAPWIVLKFLESARFVRFSGKSLAVLAV